ncbi:serine hydrolase [Alishewanella tabrizica]|uniref:Beta-lactamase class A catalytic domain-containing protein n=1 Tax=Alishewanella tabrizica TaxID=671278 RepID=A0ABQ2WWY2_9ALTE|nr:serine hydrolase [Alishewanella tabrizica]GGW72724.1 hypothetical protein GCM10008111_31140 [Alishewanella tabrizica]
MQAAVSCQPLDSILTQRKAHYPVLAKVLDEPEKYQVQILYTRVESDTTKARLHYYHYQVDPSRYFYPASTVKLPLAALALQWLAEQQIPHLTEDSVMLTDTARAPQTVAHQDPTAPSGLPSISHYIKKILLVSDNDASNRLYELLGQEYINEQLLQKGLSNTVINHRLSVPFSDDDNRYFNPVRFLDNEGNMILQLGERKISESYRNNQQPKLGIAYYKGGELVAEPMDFTLKNRQSLNDFDGVIKRIILPELFAPEQRFRFSDSQRSLLMQYMRTMPRHSRNPEYPELEYPDSYVKYFIFGGQPDRIPDHINYYNKNGQAYGHVIDGAYIEDTKEGIAFFLTVIIYTNENQILNDDTYETDTIGQPFMRELGDLIYNYQLGLKRMR